MNVLEPLRTYSSPSRRAVDFMEPNASEPELGSVMAHAPILSIVSRSSAHRSFCSIVPLAMIADEVRPIDTPMAVTMPGQTRHSSMIGIMVKATELVSRPAPSAGASGSTPDRSRSMRRLKDSRAMESMPKVENNFRSRSYGGRSPNSRSSRRGRISLSMKSLTADLTISCSSDHLCIELPLGRTTRAGPRVT